MEIFCLLLCILDRLRVSNTPTFERVLASMIGVGEVASLTSSRIESGEGVPL